MVFEVISVHILILSRSGLSGINVKVSRGLRKDDTLSPLLFIIVMEALNKLLEKVKVLDLLLGVRVGRRSQ